MEANFHESIDEFYDLVYPFLLKNEAQNNLPLAILNSLKNDISRYGKEKPLLCSLIDNKKLELIALRTPPHDLIIAYTDNVNAVISLVDALFERGEEIPGVLSFKEAADMFAKLWSKKKSLKTNLFRRERVYQLERVSEGCIGTMVFSVAKKPHKALVLQWAGDMMKEAMIDITDEEIENARRNFAKEFDEDKSNFYILFDNSEPVSIARRAGKTPNGSFVNYVYTPPSLRRRGYATECVAKLSKLFLEEGNKYCFLFTDLSNPTSNSIYQKIGYKPIIDENHYKFLKNEIWN